MKCFAGFSTLPRVVGVERLKSLIRDPQLPQGRLAIHVGHKLPGNTAIKALKTPDWVSLCNGWVQPFASQDLFWDFGKTIRPASPFSGRLSRPSLLHVNSFLWLDERVRGGGQLEF